MTEEKDYKNRNQQTF